MYRMQLIKMLNTKYISGTYYRVYPHSNYGTHSIPNMVMRPSSQLFGSQCYSVEDILILRSPDIPAIMPQPVAWSVEIWKCLCLPFSHDLSYPALLMYTEFSAGRKTYMRWFQYSDWDRALNYYGWGWMNAYLLRCAACAFAGQALVTLGIIFFKLARQVDSNESVTVWSVSSIFNRLLR